MARVGAERRAQPDFARPPRDADRHQREDAQRRQQQDQRGHARPCGNWRDHRRNPAARSIRRAAARPGRTIRHRHRPRSPAAGGQRGRIAAHAHVHHERRHRGGRPGVKHIRGLVTRSSGSRPKSRTTPTISNHGSCAAETPGSLEYRRRAPIGDGDPAGHEFARERFVDDDRSGGGTAVAARGTRARRRSGDRMPRRNPDRPPMSDADLVRRAGAGRDLDGRAPFARQSDPGARSANVTATTPGSCAMRCASPANVRARRSPKANVVSPPAGRSSSRRAARYSSTRKLRADCYPAHRLARALDGDGDGDGRQRHLGDHRGRPDAAEAQRAAAGTQVREVRLHARARDSQRRQERHHGRADDREAAGIEHRRESSPGAIQNGTPPLPSATALTPQRNVRSAASRPTAAATTRAPAPRRRVDR